MTRVLFQSHLEKLKKVFLIIPDVDLNLICLSGTKKQPFSVVSDTLIDLSDDLCWRYNVLHPSFNSKNRTIDFVYLDRICNYEYDFSILSSSFTCHMTCIISRIELNIILWRNYDDY